VTRRRLLLLCGAFFALRLVLVLCAADQLSEPDAAETKLMRIGDEWVGTGAAPSVERLLWYARAGTNAPHGAYLLVSLLYALLVVPIGAAGSYLALKLVAIGFATLALAAWTATAWRLGGSMAAWTTGLLLALSPPPLLAGGLVAWGSHPESVALVGLCAWAVTSGRIRTVGDSAVAGALLGATAGLNLLVAPIVAVLAIGWGWDRWRDADGRARSLVALAVGAVVPLAGLLWLTGAASASVVETAGSSPVELLWRAQQGADGPVLTTITSLLPLRVWSPTAFGAPLGLAARLGLDLGLSLGLLGALVAATWRLRARRDLLGRGVALLWAAPAVHLLTLALLAPRRPAVPARYLLPAWPLALLALALALAWWWPRRPARAVLCAVVLAWLVPGLSLHVERLRPGRMQAFDEYRPAAWLAADIGHVGYEEAPWVNRFLEARGGEQTDGFGFVAGAGATDDPLAEEADSHLDAAALLDRRDAWLAAGGPTSRDRLHENIGWGLSVFAWQRSGVWHGVLSRLPDEDRAATARGLGAGLGLRGEPGCQAIERYSGPDRAAMKLGAAMIGPCR
jgi:hypothetical protein